MIKQRMPIVYILNLGNGKKYVGYTNNYKKRMNAHFTGRGSMVTRKYNPKFIEKIIPCYNINYALTVERNVTLKLRKKYGKNKVRGSYWVNSKNF